MSPEELDADARLVKQIADLVWEYDRADAIVTLAYAAGCVLARMPASARKPMACALGKEALKAAKAYLIEEEEQESTENAQ